jgi:release factor glutamine methyltransferase
MTTKNAESWTITDILNWSTKYLEEKGSDTARLDAQLLISDALDLTRIQLYTNFDQCLNGAERKSVRDLLTRRASGEPVAYILGSREFMGHSFKVTPAVLIPRPDTEVLVEKVLASADKEKPLQILDIGTGSGCIAISIAAGLEFAQVTAWDKSADALDVAKTNATSLEVENVQFIEKDALDAGSWNDLTFDIIVSNPPYITDSEMKELAIGVIDFEPEMALSGGEDGLTFYRYFAGKTSAALNAGGSLYWEIGSTQSESVSNLLVEAGFVDIAVIKDYAGHDRVVTARKEG